MERILRALVLGFLGTGVMIAVSISDMISDPIGWAKEMPIWFWPFGLFMFLAPFLDRKDKKNTNQDNDSSTGIAFVLLALIIILSAYEGCKTVDEEYKYDDQGNYVEDTE